MLLNRQEKHDIVLEIVDSLYEKLVNELDYHLMDNNPSYYGESGDEYEDLFEEMTIQVVN